VPVTKAAEPSPKPFAVLQWGSSLAVHEAEKLTNWFFFFRHSSTPWNKKRKYLKDLAQKREKLNILAWAGESCYDT